VINSAVITTPGIYSYRLISINEAKDWLEAGHFVSTIGYKETADALSSITGIPVDVNRRVINMEVYDEALVFRLTCRLSDPSLKGNVTIDFIKENSELGILRKLPY
jgi:hypothetical protein